MTMDANTQLDVPWPPQEEACKKKFKGQDVFGIGDASDCLVVSVTDLRVH